MYPLFPTAYTVGFILVPLRGWVPKSHYSLGQGVSRWLGFPSYSAVWGKGFHRREGRGAGGDSFLICKPWGFSRGGRGNFAAK